MNLTKYISLFIVLATLPVLGTAQTPELPHTVNGNVSVDGGPFEDSYSGPIHAVNEGTVYGETQAEDGSFSDMPVTGPEDGEFTLWIGQVETDISLVYESGEVTDVEEELTASVDDLNAELDISQTNVEPGDTVEFDAASSSGSTGINSIQWNLPDDETRECEVENVAASELDCETIEYTFEDEGTFDIELTVFDATGNADTAEQPVNVEAPNTGGGGGGDDGGTGGGGFAPVADDTEDVNQSNETASEAVNDTDDGNVNGTVIEPEDQQPPVPETNATTTGTDDTTTGANDPVNETQGQEQQPQQGGTGIGGFITANTPSLISALVGVLIIGGIVWYVRRP